MHEIQVMLLINLLLFLVNLLDKTNVSVLTANVAYIRKYLLCLSATVSINID